MATPSDQKTKEKRNLAERIKRLPLFWKYFLMMTVVLALSLVVLTVINRMYLKTLSDKLLSEMQSKLEYDCKKTDERLYSTSVIPAVIENTRYYHYLIGPLGQDLELKYFPILDYLQRELKQQLYLTSEAEESILYSRAYNFVVGTSHFERLSEDYFGKYLLYSDISGEEILSTLRAHKGQICLPMQKVTIAGTEKECLSVILWSANTSTVLMNLYSMETITGMMGLSDLPEGSSWILYDSDGGVLASAGLAESDAGDRSTLTARWSYFGFIVRLEIPKSYFDEMLKTPRMNGIISILLVVLLGSMLAIGFSNLSVRPIKKLIVTHGNTENKDNSNELLSLDELLSSSRENQVKMSLRLKKQTLAKAFYGGVLSEEEENQLRNQIPYVQKAYQVALIHTSPDINAALGKQFEILFPHATWTMLSTEETGLLFESAPNNTSALARFVSQMNLQMENEGVYCGISEAFSSVSDLNAAAKQARRAVPVSPGVDYYQSEAGNGHSISWIQVERLYQCVMDEEEEGALRQLGKMAEESRGTRSEELFHVIRFVLQNAASEFGVADLGKEEFEYHLNLSSEGNIRNLSLLVRRILDSVRQKRESEKQNLKNEVLNYIRTHLKDSEMNAASVAEQFGMTERSIYETVRSLTGKTFKEYLTDVRMDKASSLLYGTNLDISEVAEACGYSNNSTFYRLFQNYFGISPGSFRKNGEA